MIPRFPQFKKVEVGDRAAVETHTRRYPPYSDFNFTSLWAWDMSDERMISELNGNLVVRFTDYHTHEPFFSFLGTNEPEQTAHELIRFAEESGISPMLRLIPSESITLGDPMLSVREDRDNFDYIFSTAELSELRGARLKTQRHLVTRFLREHSGVTFRVEDVRSSHFHSGIIEVLHIWKQNKELTFKEYSLESEASAINRLLQSGDTDQIVTSSVVLDGRMVAFSIDELLPNGYAISHFAKADTCCVGVLDFITMSVANHLLEVGARLWNWEQDLGISGLRVSKEQYRPINFLKKDIIVGCSS